MPPKQEVCRIIAKSCHISESGFPKWQAAYKNGWWDITSEFQGIIESAYQAEKAAAVFWQSNDRYVIDFDKNEQYKANRGETVSSIRRVRRLASSEDVVSSERCQTQATQKTQVIQKTHSK